MRRLAEVVSGFLRGDALAAKELQLTLQGDILSFRLAPIECRQYALAKCLEVASIPCIESDEVAAIAQIRRIHCHTTTSFRQSVLHAAVLRQKFAELKLEPWFKRLPTCASADRIALTG